MKIKALLGVGFSAFLTMVVALWLESLKAEKGSVVGGVLASMGKVNEASIDVGLLRYVLIAGPFLGILIVVVKIASVESDYKKQMELFDRPSRLALLFDLSYLCRMVNFLLSKVELWIRGWDLMKALDFLNEWVFLKFSSTIVGSFLGFMLASLALGEIQLAKFIGFLFITMMLYLMLLASFFWYRPFVKDANKLELVGALFFGVVVVLFFAIFLK